MNLTPIVLFTYKRIDTLKISVQALAKNNLASQSVLYVFSDAAGKAADEAAVAEVRSYLRTISGFKEIILREAPSNQGLAKSIIGGVSEVLDTYGTAIVLEDDLVPSQNFLDFMNEALRFYKDDKRIISVSGFSFPMHHAADYKFDNYFTMRGSSWGWATWKDRWDGIDWSVSDYKSFSTDPARQRAFNRMGSDLSGMLARQMTQKINSWAIRWVYHQFIKQTYTVFPVVSKIKNVGFGEGATHTVQKYNRFDTKLDHGNQSSFSFNPIPELNPRFIRQFTKRYGLWQRGLYKILNTLSK